MNSLHHSNLNTTATCYFTPPGISLAVGWRIAMDFLGRMGLASELYEWRAGGTCRHENQNRREKSSGTDILSVLKTEPASSWSVHLNHGSKNLSISLEGPYPTIPYQFFSIFSLIPELPLENAGPLIEALAPLGRLALAYSVEAQYRLWQTCTDLRQHLEHYGPVDGLPNVRIPANPPFPAEVRLDISTNPGRGDVVNGGPASVAADMWLGPAFWSYAPCQKEEVVAQSWLEVRDTEHFLYIKAYPEPFTRPDGEQGEIQRRLWKLLFHSDCRWPPAEK